MIENKIEERNYVVYKHTSPDGKVYIGITGQNPPEKRWANGHGYTQNEYFDNEIIRYGWDNFMHEILDYNLTRVEAQEKECALIAQYKSTDRNFGYNIKSGGFRQVLDGNKVKIVGNGGGKSSISVNQYTCLGDFVQTFDNALIAEFETGVCVSNIIKCCEEKLQSAGKFVWRYNDPNYNSVPYNYRINKQIIQYTKDGIFVRTYNSIISAAKDTNIDQSSITKCCRDKVKSAGGFIWRYASDIADPYVPLFSTTSPTTPILSEIA